MLVDVGICRKRSTVRLLPVIVAANAGQRVGRLVGRVAGITGGLVTGQYDRGNALFVTGDRFNALYQAGGVSKRHLAAGVGLCVGKVCQADTAKNRQPCYNTSQQRVAPTQHLFQILVQIRAAVQQLDRHYKEKPWGQVGKGHQGMDPAGYDADGVHGQRQADNVGHQQENTQRALPQLLLSEQPDDQHRRQCCAQQKQ